MSTTSGWDVTTGCVSSGYISQGSGFIGGWHVACGSIMVRDSWQKSDEPQSGFPAFTGSLLEKEALSRTPRNGQEKTEEMSSGWPHHDWLPCACSGWPHKKTPCPHFVVRQHPIGVVNTYHPTDPHLRHIAHDATRFATEISGEMMISEIRHPIYDVTGKLVQGAHLSETPRDCDYCPQYVGGWSIKTCSGCPNETIYAPPGFYKDYGIRQSIELNKTKKEIEILKDRIKHLEEHIDARKEKTEVFRKTFNCTYKESFTLSSGSICYICPSCDRVGRECLANDKPPVYERDPRSQCTVNRRGDPPESCGPIQGSGSFVARYGTRSQAGLMS